MLIGPDALRTALEATWPPANRKRAGPWAIRDGQGGGARVSATTAEGVWTPGDIARAEAEMLALRQPLLFMVREGEDDLDAALASQGYFVHDPVQIYAAAPEDIRPPPEPMTAFPHWPPLAIAHDIWQQANIGPPRFRVMDRAPMPKSAILGRARDRPAGVAFVALHKTMAVLHALEIVADQRRHGAASNIVRSAACWAADLGATSLVLAVTERNLPARSLYASLGMQVVGRYHYRTK